MKRFTVKRVVSESGRIAWGIQDHKLGRLTGIMLFRADARMVRDRLIFRKDIDRKSQTNLLSSF